MPPKRKGKVRIFPPLSLPSPIQAEISRFMISPAIIKAGHDDSGASISQGGLVVPTEETSLSPNTGLPPAIREGNGTIGEAEGDLNLSNCDAGEEDTRTQGQIAQSALDVEGAEGGIELMPPPKGLETSLTNRISPIPLTRPAVVTLENLWEMMAGMIENIKGLENKVDSLSKGHQQEVFQTQKQIKESSERIKKLELNEKKHQDFHITLIKERESIVKRIEAIENNSKRLNLRILNFPRIIGEAPLVSLKKFLNESLGFVEDDSLTVLNSYFLPRPKNPPSQEINQMFQGNLTNFLEDSQAQVIERGTLLASFSTINDVNILMKRYFAKFPINYFGQNIKIFPDLAVSTQVRRKAFLGYRQDVIALGFSFKLRFPCKCLIAKQNEVFIFSMPEHLKNFLETRQVATSSPLPNVN
ncbi:uncharacterized protein LOC115082945 [Rhinatrema bivittatum]|uniref:uncharacterized protein LOC115082945 n=1 Tax=Rhinatrema bivittatum TaxID=194408 RepID=UPI00112EB943|nr:uncharacterized protein LOC115082945 [Rhinatrema bivittatum]